MSIDGRQCITTASTELSIDFPLMKADQQAIDYVTKRTSYGSFTPVEPDHDAEYADEYLLEVADLDPQVACPHKMQNVKPVSEVKDVEVDLAFVGACTNGRLDDMRSVASILKGQTVHPNVRLLVRPATRNIYLQAVTEGIPEIVVEAGGMFGIPSCHPCFGGNLAAGEVAITASTRNFRGRMGSPDAYVYCASPHTVAASAITGRITDPREI
jgi:3-isopropylmalate/(R)-2-methylmalate dehydratase large subunit